MFFLIHIPCRFVERQMRSWYNDCYSDWPLPWFVTDQPGEIQHAGCPVGLHFLTASVNCSQLSRVKRQGAQALLNTLISALSPSCLTLPWHNTQWCPRYCQPCGKRWKRQENLVGPCPRQSPIFFLVEKGKKTKSFRRHCCNSTRLHITIHLFSGLSVSGRIQ